MVASWPLGPTKVFTMSQSFQAEIDHETIELDESDRHLLLSVERRREALDIITNGPTMFSLNDLAVAVAEREASESVPPDELVERVAITLHHNHLPKMEEFGVVDYDPNEHLVVRNRASD
jgi:acyl-coenzyme A thioesterase PaaI-like protein